MRVAGASRAARPEAITALVCRRERDAREAAARIASEHGGAATTLSAAGTAWSDGAGGTSGALWGALLTAVGTALGDTAAPTDQTLEVAVDSACDAVLRLGGAELGDKTMVDALVPFTTAFRQSEGPLTQRLDAAATAAGEGAASTADLIAKRGRARPLGEKSLGTPDPGATSFALIARRLSELAH